MLQNLYKVVFIRCVGSETEIAILVLSANRHREILFAGQFFATTRKVASTAIDSQNEGGPMSSNRTSVNWEEVEQSGDFQKLRKSHRRFVFPLTVAFMVWYFGYVLLAAYAKDFMSIPVIGSINIGLLLGLGQFVSTFAITALYVSFANKRHDPLAEKIYLEIESGEKH